jgi:hypothetical protein
VEVLEKGGTQSTRRYTGEYWGIPILCKNDVWIEMIQIKISPFLKRFGLLNNIVLQLLHL